MKKPPELPFVLKDRTGYLSYPAVALEPSFHALRCVVRSVAYNTIVDITVSLEVIENPNEPNGPGIGRARSLYYPDKEINVQVQLAEYRKHAVEHGASPEAVRLLSGWKPWTKKEEVILADKIKGKGAAAKAGASKTKPVGGGGKVGGNRGNPEALKKAREAAAERGPDVRKITILNKENPYRAESNRAASFNALKGAKTVEDFKTAGGKVKYLSRWVSEGRIKLT